MFVFDPAKSEANKSKYGIDFVEAQALWDNERRLELPSRHVGSEERWLVIGAIGERRWTAVVTHRGQAIRLISCRRAKRDEELLCE